MKVDGKTLSLAGVVAAARHHAKISLDDSASIKEKVVKSRKVIADKVASGASVYGLSTGFGGSGASLIILIEYSDVNHSFVQLIRGLTSP